MTAFWHKHPEVEAAGAEMRERAFDVARVLETHDESEPGEWAQRYEEAVQARQEAENAHDSAVLWADLDDAIAWTPAPPEPEAGQ